MHLREAVETKKMCCTFGSVPGRDRVDLIDENDEANSTHAILRATTEVLDNSWKEDGFTSVVVTPGD